MPLLTHPLLTLRHLALLAVIYIRQSTLSQLLRHTGSTDVQRKLVALARAYGFPDASIRVLDEDLGKSGKSTVGRIAWDEMLRLIASGAVGAVFFYDVKRLAREVRAFNELLVLCRYNNTIMVLDDRPTDPTNPNDTALLQIQAAFAELDNHSRTDLFRRSRRAKAEKGEIVWNLPVGYVKNPDGTAAFDPEVKPAIDDAIQTFFEVGTLRGAVKRLNESGKKLPSRYRGRRLVWGMATVDRLQRILLLPAYAGFQTYGRTEHRPEFGLYPSGAPRRKRVPKERWINIPNGFPAYMTPEQQERIRKMLAEHAFTQRSRPGNGEALFQGLVRCLHCGGMLATQYPKPNHGPHRYQCNVLSSKYGASPCCSIQGAEFDAAVRRAVIGVLRTPPLDVLREALAAAREADRTHAARLDADRERLAYQVKLAEDRYEQADPHHRRVFAFASEQLEKALKEQSDFDQRLAVEPPRPSADATEEELRELCALAADIPRIWSHPAVAHRERKEILRCLMDCVKVSTTPESVEIVIAWASGEESPLRLWRRAGVDELIRQRHAEGMSAREIRNWLARGDATTGQRWDRTTAAVYQAFRRLGLEPRRQTMAPHRVRVRELYDSGKTPREIAALLNASGSRTPNGNLWELNSVHRALGRKLGRDRYAQLDRELLADAERRGLTAKQTAEEFNAKQVPRYSREPWTAEAVRLRRAALKYRARRAGRSVAEKDS